MKSIFELLRISQWIKNLICFSGVLFGGHINNTEFWELHIFGKWKILLSKGKLRLENF